MRRTTTMTTWGAILAAAGLAMPAGAVAQDPRKTYPPNAPAEGAIEAARLAATSAAVAPRPGVALALGSSMATWAPGGVFHKSHLQTLAADHRIKGDQAAALATLIRHFTSDQASFGAGDLDSGAVARRLDSTYRAMAEKLRKAERTLFVGGRPHFDRLHQGPAGDCFLFSGAGWVARFHPDRIVEMIRPLPGDRFEVVFPSGERAVVSGPTDTELACNESAGTLEDGIWMPVLEKAVGTLDGRKSKAAAAIPDPSLRVNLGGSARDDIRRWTGRPPEVFHLKDRNDADRALPALERMERHRLMAQAVVPVTHPRGPLPMGHVYAVLGFDSGTRVLTVWNPWGDDFTPKGPAGIDNGWPRKHGVFQIPFRDFVRVFSYLDVERR